VGDFIESACRAYFNRINGENFQWTQYCYQQLYEFLGPEMPGVDTQISDAQTDANRARGQRSPGQVHVRGAEDRAEFVGPEMSGAVVGRQATQDMRDGILRMIAQMALSQDTSGAMLRRSAESKKQDAVGQEILLGSIGKRLLTTSIQTAKLLMIARGEDPEDAPPMEGYTNFDINNADDVIQQSMMVEAMSIPSATYQIEQKYRMAITHLGDGASDETKQKIHEELEGSITQDQFDMASQMAMDALDPNQQQEEDQPAPGQKKPAPGKQAA
jgi:hypothetical protein